MSKPSGEVSRLLEPVDVDLTVFGRSDRGASSLAELNPFHTLANHKNVALVRWPPVGRKKCMHDGAVLGRNELIQDSIRRDTGIVRDRKQVSSHLQVLRAQLNNFPSGE